MTPYYSDDLVTLYHGDCLELDVWLGADVLVTDPPYGVAYESGWVPNRTRRPIAGDNSVAVRDQALAMWGERRPAVVFGSWTKPRPARTRARLIWSKGADEAVPF